MPAEIRRALTIGVAEFAAPYPGLTYATAQAADLKHELANLGYTEIPPAEEPWTSKAIGQSVLRAITEAGPDDVIVVHLLTHGEVNERNDTLYAIGSDAQQPAEADVESWLKLLHDGQPRPLVLFILDICQSGTAVRFGWLGNTADGTARAWVIAACSPREQAFNGRLTQATTNVLRSLKELDIGPAVEYVPISTVGRAIRKEVARLADNEPDNEQGLPQQVTGTQLDFTADLPDLPFFKNPAFTRRPVSVVIDDRELTPFADNIDEPASWTAAEEPEIDPAVGARHFKDRARGHGNLTAPKDAGCFTGRLDELTTLVDWLRRPGDKTLSVVTGGPGVGKSAILGVLVCAAHPDLRTGTETLWGKARRTPDEMPNLVAAHARQLDLADITASLARQLTKVLHTKVDPAHLVEAITAATGDAPVIVLDALDEAIGAKDIVSDLLLKLIAARRPDNTPACRLLIGTRRDGFEPLLDAARAQGGLIDLDETDRGRLQEDLSAYVGKLLRTQPGYRDRALASARGAFAEALASALSVPDSDRRWGEFLIAGLYTHSFIRTTGDDAISDPNLAGNRGAACPRTLPEVLELDLADRPNAGELRQVLQIVSLARGAGMPASVIDRCRDRRPQHGPWTPTRELLAELGFYLRRSNDEDGTILYRIFHEGLAEELRPPQDGPDDSRRRWWRLVVAVPWGPGGARRPAEQAIVTAMLRDLGPASLRRWDLAEPYILRHVVDHALAGTDGDGDSWGLLTDPEFLVHADPAVRLALEHVETPLARDARHILAAAQERGTAPPAERRLALALAAARVGNPYLARAICHPPPGSPDPAPPWYPVWTADNVSALTAGLIDDVQTVALAIGSTWGRSGDRRLECRSVMDGLPRGEYPISSDAANVRVIGICQGIALITLDYNGTLLTTDIATGRQEASAISLWQDPRLRPVVYAIETVRLAGRILAALPASNGFVPLIDVASGRVFNHFREKEAAITLVIDGKEYRLIRSADFGDVGVAVATMRETEEGFFPFTQGFLTHTGSIMTLTTMTLDGHPVAVTASLDGTVRFWDVPTCREIEHDRLTLPGPITAVAPAGETHLAVLCSGEAIVYARTAPQQDRPTP